MSNRAELVFVLREEAAPNVQVGQAAAANPRPQSATQPGQAASAAAPGFSTPKPPSAQEATAAQQNAELARAVKETFAERTQRLDAERRAADAVMAERRAAGKAKWDEYGRTGRLPGAAAATTVQPPVFPGDDGPRESKPGAPPIAIKPPPVIGKAAAEPVERPKSATVAKAAAEVPEARVVGQAASSAASALAGLSTGVVAASAATGVVTTAITLLGKAANTAVENLERFARFSGEAAASQARIEIARLRQDINLARQNGGTFGRFAEARNRGELAAERIWQTIASTLVDRMTPFVETGVGFLEAITNGIPEAKSNLEKLNNLFPMQATLTAIHAALKDNNKRADIVANLPPEADILGLFRELPPLAVEWGGKKFIAQQGAPEAIDTHFAGPLPVLGGI